MTVYKFKKDGIANSIEREITRVQKCMYADNGKGNWQDKLDDLHNRLLEEHVKEFYDYLNNVKMSDQFVRDLKSSTATVKLLDEFGRSKKVFLVLKNHIYLDGNEEFASLIISEAVPECFNNLAGLKKAGTFTELRKLHGKPITKILAKTEGFSQDTIAFLNEIDELDTYNYVKKRYGEEKILLFEKPYILGGQSSMDRIGYGYGMMQYGDTSDYWILGLLI